MDSMKRIYAGIHPTQLNEGWLSDFLSRVRSWVQDSMTVFKQWITGKRTGTVGELKRSLEQKMTEFRREAAVTEDKEGIAALVAALGGAIDVNAPMEIGRRMANSLLDPTVGVTDLDDRADIMAAATMWADMFKVSSLADLIVMHLPQQAKDAITDAEVKAIGYWFLRTLLLKLKGESYIKDEQPVAAYVSGTIAKDVRKLLERRRVVYADKGINPLVRPLSDLGASKTVRLEDSDDYQAVFGSRMRRGLFNGWVFSDPGGDIQFVVEVPYNRLVPPRQTLDIIDKRRKRNLALISNVNFEGTAFETLAFSIYDATRGLMTVDFVGIYHFGPNGEVLRVFRGF